MSCSLSAAGSCLSLAPMGLGLWPSGSMQVGCLFQSAHNDNFGQCQKVRIQVRTRAHAFYLSYLPSLLSFILWWLNLPRPHGSSDWSHPTCPTAPSTLGGEVLFLITSVGNQHFFKPPNGVCVCVCVCVTRPRCSVVVFSLSWVGNKFFDAARKKSRCQRITLLDDDDDQVFVKHDDR